MIKLATGYIPSFLGRLNIADDVELIELGYGSSKSIFRSPKKGIQDYTGDYSCHFGRSPITEEKSIQKKFINKLALDHELVDNFISIGFHLSGRINSNIGKYGFTSHYIPSSNNEKSAIQFISEVSERLETNVWIENANYYSTNGEDIVNVWHSTFEIADKSDSRLIIDLAHLVIDCNNSGACPELMLGMIPWSMVAEIHISGISIDNNKRFHDGHSLPVHEDCWRLLDILIHHFSILDLDIYINIEHTDECWIDKKNSYIEDFEKLRIRCLKLIFPSDSLSIDPDAELYARRYVNQKMGRIITNLEEISLYFGIQKKSLLNDWLDHQLKLTKGICFSRDEIGDNSSYCADAFSNYIDLLRKEF